MKAKLVLTNTIITDSAVATNTEILEVEYSGIHADKNTEYIKNNLPETYKKFEKEVNHFAVGWINNHTRLEERSYSFVIV